MGGGRHPIGGGSMNLIPKKGRLARERLPSPHVNVGLCDVRRCTADVYFYICVNEKAIPTTLADDKTANSHLLYKK